MKRISSKILLVIILFIFCENYTFCQTVYGNSKLSMAIDSNNYSIIISEGEKILDSLKKENNTSYKYARLLGIVAESNHMQKNYMKSLLLLEKSTQLLRDLYPDKKKELLSHTYLKANSQSFLDLDKSAEYYEDSYKLSEIVFKDSSIVVAYLDRLVGILITVNSLEKAEIYAKELNLQAVKYFGIKSNENLKAIEYLGWMFQVNGNFDNSIKYYTQLLDLYKELNYTSVEHFYNLKNQLATSYYYARVYSKAAVIFDETMNASQTLFGNTSISYITALGGAALTYSSLEEHKKAIKLNLKKLKITKKVLGENHLEYMSGLSNTGLAYHSAGILDKSIEYYSKALESSNRLLGTKHPKSLITLGNIALAYHDLGDFHKSVSTNLVCLDYRKETIGDDHPDYILSLNNLSLAYIGLGDLQNGLNYILKAKEKADIKLSFKNELKLNIYNGASECYRRLGDFSKALELNSLAQDGLSETYGINNYFYLISKINEANIYGDLFNYEKSKDLLLSIKSDVKINLGKEHPTYLLLLGNLGMVYSRLGQHNKAISIKKEQYELSKKTLGLDHPSVLLAGNNLASEYSILNENKKAVDLYKVLSTIADSTLSETHDYNFMILNNLWELYIDEADFINSDYLVKKLSQLNLKRVENNLKLNASYQLFLKENALALFESYAHYSLNRIMESSEPLNSIFNSWLQLNGIVNNESLLIRNEAINSSDSSFTNVYERWKKQKLQLIKYYESSDSELESNGIFIHKEEDYANKLERDLYLKSKLFSKKSEKTTIKNIQKELSPKEAYIDIIRLPFYDDNINEWTDSLKYVICIITKQTDKTPIYISIDNGNILEDEISSNYLQNHSLKNRTNSYKNGIPYKYFWKPLEKALEGKTKIYVAKGGVYNKINLATLYNYETQKYLIEEKEIIPVNNGRSFIESKTDTVEKYYSNTNAVLFGFPNYESTISDSITITNDEFFASTRDLTTQLIDSLSRSGSKASPLPETKKEVENISKELKSSGWNVEVFTKNKASEANIKKVNSPRVLHIATHGFFMNQAEVERSNGLSFMGVDKNNSMEEPLLRSGLLFAGANQTLQGKDTDCKENGILTAYEAAFLNLSETELVILSACETGKGEITNGEGVYGLRKSFADAGAKNVIMSLWNVDDKVTQKFMTLFYANWNQGKTIREAFNSTRNSIKEKYPSPYYWGAFVLVGEL